jgi:small subunit ribosomal protein S11
MNKTASSKTASSASKVLTSRERKKLVLDYTSTGIIHLTTTKSNIFMLFENAHGRNVLKQTAGSIGLKGSRKSSAYNATLLGHAFGQKLTSMKVDHVDCILKGHGIGRENAIRALWNSGLKIASLDDKTFPAFGGVRPKSRRRI